jgi:hypothetical protein
VKEGYGEAPTKQPREEDLPSDDEGLKSSHSGRSSPEALVVGDSEKGWALGMSNEHGDRKVEEVPTVEISLAAA